MTRFIQQGRGGTPIKQAGKPQAKPKPGSYTVKDLSAKGVKSGVWEKKDG